MEGASRSNMKRPRDNDGETPTQKRVRFPKGKKVKEGAGKLDIVGTEADTSTFSDPRLAAKERAIRRTAMTTSLFNEESSTIDISAAEIKYEDNEKLDDDGIQLEPFNLDKEREEGYFDSAGNFVEYVNKTDDIKDAWLDNLDIETKFAERASVVTSNEEDIPDLSSDEIGKMKRRIADVLEPGETVLQALRRLKGNSSNRKEKMSAETKQLFDQLTEDSMKLMENGDYDVYHEKQEVFQREAEGYETLARAREKGTATNSELNGSSAEIVSGNNADTYDMFGEDDENVTVPPSSVPNSSTLELHSEALTTGSNAGFSQSDYVYDDSTGYYYSSSLGYYYDPSSGLYCCASSGQWYSFNEEMGTYNQVQETATAISQE